MNFLGVGPLELLIVGTLAYFLLGPKKMGEVGKTIGKILRDVREQRDEFTSLLMDSVDLEDKPKSSATPKPAMPSTPVGAVPQSGDPGDSEGAEKSNVQADTDGEDQDTASDTNSDPDNPEPREDR